MLLIFDSASMLIGNQIFMIILRRLIEIAFCFIFLASNSAQGQIIKVTLLGTGAPTPVIDRFGPSILVEAEDRKFVFDVGRGSLQRLTQIKVKQREIEGVFFTHLHSDHIVGFPDFWLTGWLTGQRIAPLQVWGPEGTREMSSSLEKAFEFDIKIRISDDKASPDGVVINAEDIKEGIVYEKNGVKITAFEVDHAPVKPAFGYRIDYAGRSVVLSGDTRRSENLIKYAQGVDLLIHEIVSEEALKRTQQNAERVKSVVAHHTSPEQAGEIFSKTKPKLAVLSHIVPPTANEADLIPLIRKTYSGALVLGEDLMVIEVGEKIVIRRPNISKTPFRDK